MTPTPADASAASADIEALSKIIALPERPVAVLWQRRVMGAPHSAVPGPTDWQLQAVLTFDEAGARRIVAAAEGRPRPRIVGTIENLDWFPAAIKENLRPAPNSSKFNLNGETYDASAFAKPPLSQGYLVRVGESGQFFLNLYTQ